MRRLLGAGFVVVAGSFVLAGCGSGDSLFTYGAPESVHVASAEATEVTVGGYVFVFPEGADGTLTVTPIRTGPPPPLAGGEGLKVEFTGTQPVQIKAVLAEGEVVDVFGWGMLVGSVDDGVDAENRWVGVPGVEAGGGVVLFDLPLPSPASGAKARFTPRPSTYRGSDNYWFRKIRPDSTEADRRVWLSLQVSSHVDDWLAALPDDLRSAAAAAVAGPRSRARS